MRGARFVVTDDIMFLLRHSQRKLKRAAKFLQSKEMRHRALKQAAGGGADEDDISDAADVVSTAAAAAASKRRKLAFEFLASPDNPHGEIDTADDADDDYLEKMERADQRAQAMDPGQYLEFAESRQVNFYKKTAKFRDWLDGPSLIDAKPNQTVLELLGYLAYETVGELVHVSLLTKRDMDGESEPLSESYAAASDRAPVPPPVSVYGKTPTFLTVPAATTTVVLNSPAHSPTHSPPSSPSPPLGTAVNPSEANRVTKAKKRQRPKGSGTVALDILSFSDPLRPEHVREAFRRHQRSIGPMSPYSSFGRMTVRRQSLCC